jgi:hypothetical protein
MADEKPDIRKLIFGSTSNGNQEVVDALTCNLVILPKEDIIDILKSLEALKRKLQPLV